MPHAVIGYGDLDPVIASALHASDLNEEIALLHDVNDDEWHVYRVRDESGLDRGDRWWVERPNNGDLLLFTDSEAESTDELVIEWACERFSLDKE